MSIKKVGDHWECDGMCFSKDIVLNDIFSLIGIINSTGDKLGSDKNADTYYTFELTRLISTISIYCRNQLTSYFHTCNSSLSSKDKLKDIKSKYPGADGAIFSKVGTKLCKKNGQVDVTFYDMIRKFCHVEKWRYPMTFFTPSLAGNNEVADVDNLFFISVKEANELKDNVIRVQVGCILEVEVTEIGQPVASGRFETCRIAPPLFANAARIFITDCADCQMVEGEPDASCDA